MAPSVRQPANQRPILQLAHRRHALQPGGLGASRWPVALLETRCGPLLGHAHSPRGWPNAHDGDQGYPQTHRRHECEGSACAGRTGGEWLKHLHMPINARIFSVDSNESLLPAKAVGREDTLPASRHFFGEYAMKSSNPAGSGSGTSYRKGGSNTGGVSSPGTSTGSGSRPGGGKFPIPTSPPGNPKHIRG